MVENEYNQCLDGCDVGPHNCKWPWRCLLTDPDLKYDKDLDEFTVISKRGWNFPNGNDPHRRITA